MVHKSIFQEAVKNGVSGNVLRQPHGRISNPWQMQV